MLTLYIPVAQRDYVKDRLLTVALRGTQNQQSCGVYVASSVDRVTIDSTVRTDEGVLISPKLPADARSMIPNTEKPMKSVIINATTLLAVLTITNVEAATLYRSIAPTPSYQLEANASGQVYGVANSNGSVVYAFDKSPVTSINVGPTYFGDDQSQYLTLQVGTHQVGYNSGISPILGVFLYPTGQGFSGGWFTNQFPVLDNPPVLDVNSQGQYVGISQFYGKAGTYAAFPTSSTNSVARLQ